MFSWWGAVVVIAGTLGFAMANAILGAIGFNADGFLVVLIALVGGVPVAVIALAVNAPKYIAIILTAFAGATWLTVGIALLPGIIRTADLDRGPLAALYLTNGILGS